MSTPPDAHRSQARGWALLGVLASLVFVLAAPTVARAELVTVRGGRVLKVERITYEGDTAVLALRGGGEMRAPRDFIVDVQPDELPWPEPEPEPSPVVAIESVTAEPEVPLTTDALHLLINKMANDYGVDARLAHAVIRVESNYQADAVSPKGAMGLMQLMPATARQYAVDNPFDPAQNLAGGLRHLRGLLDRYGRGKETLALAAYNAGEGAVQKYQGIPPYRETRNYVERIMSLFRQ